MTNVEYLKTASDYVRQAMAILSQPVMGSRAGMPNFPPGTVGIQIPPGATIEVVNGTMIVRSASGEVMTGPFASYDLTNPNGSGYANFLGASAQGSSGLMVTPDGQIVGYAEGGAEAYLFDIEYNGSYGPLDVHASAYAGASAEGYAGFVLDPSNLSLHAAAGGFAQVGIGVEAGANLDLGPLGNAYANGYAQAGASVGAQGEIVIDPLNGNLYAGGSFDAMAGASAGFEAGIDTPLGSARYGAEAYAGVGVSGSFDVGFKDGVFSLDAGIAAALGIGAGVNFGFDINVGNIVNNITDTVGNLGESLSDFARGDFGGGINAALDTVKNVTNVVSDGIDTATGMASGFIRGGAGMVGGAFDSIGLGGIGDAAETVGGWVASGVDAVGDVASSVVNAVGDAADAVGDAFEDVGNAVASGAKKAWNAIKSF